MKTKIIRWAGISGWYTSLITLQGTVWYFLLYHDLSHHLHILIHSSFPWRRKAGVHGNSTFLFASCNAHGPSETPTNTSASKVNKLEEARKERRSFLHPSGWMQRAATHPMATPRKFHTQHRGRLASSTSPRTFPPPIPTPWLTTLLKSRWCINNTIQSDWEYSI